MDKINKQERFVVGVGGLEHDRVEQQFPQYFHLAHHSLIAPMHDKVLYVQVFIKLLLNYEKELFTESNNSVKCI